MTTPANLPPTVWIDGPALKCVLDAHAKSQGVEPCGVLLGRAEPRAIRIAEAVPTVNAHPRAERAFLLAPAEVLKIGRAARERGLSIVGAWHGHPSGPAEVSSSDAKGLEAGSTAPGASGSPAAAPFVFLISGRGAGRSPVVRAFGPGPGGPQSLTLKSAAPPAPPKKARAPAPPPPPAPAKKKRAPRKRAAKAE